MPGPYNEDDIILKETKLLILTLFDPNLNTREVEDNSQPTTAVNRGGTWFIPTQP